MIAIVSLVSLFALYLFFKLFKSLFMILICLVGYAAIIGGMAMFLANPIPGVVFILVGGFFVGLYSSYDNARKEQLRKEEWERRQLEPWNYMN